MALNFYTTGATSGDLSRNDMLAWVNSTLKTNYARIEDFANGAAYCQLFEMIFPNSIQLRKIKRQTILENEFIQNYKLLQAAFQKHGVEKIIPVGRLVKAHFNDNFEFLKWFKKFFDANHNKAQECNSESNELPSGSTISASKTNHNTNAKSMVTAHKQRQQRRNHHGMSYIELSNKVNELGARLDQSAKETEFQYQKLRSIEVLCLNSLDSEAKNFVKKILDVMYEVEDGFVLPNSTK